MLSETKGRQIFGEGAKKAAIRKLTAADSRIEGVRGVFFPGNTENAAVAIDEKARKDGKESRIKKNPRR